MVFAFFLAYGCLLGPAVGLTSSAPLKPPAASPAASARGQTAPAASSAPTPATGPGLAVQADAPAPPATGPAAPAANTPQATLRSVVRALEQSDLAALADLLADDALAQPLRTLGAALAKARASADRLELLLKDKPGLAFTNPFAPSLQPLAGCRFEILEITRERDVQVARIRFGARGMPIREEQLVLTQVGGQWRTQLPAFLQQQVQHLAANPGHLQREIQALETLADVFKRLADDVEQNRLASKADVVARLLRYIHDSKLSERYQQP